MKKMAVVVVGYQEYAMSQKDAATLIAIAMRAKRVDKTDYRGPYHPQIDQELFASRMEIADVAEAPRKSKAEPRMLTDQTMRFLPAPARKEG